MPQWGRETVVKFFGGQLRFRLSGDRSLDEYTRDLRGMIARSHNMQPAMEAVGRYLMGATARTFAAQGRPRRWAALKPATIRDRLRRGYGPAPILVRSRTLFRSLTQPGAPYSILRARPRSLQYGSRLRYFRPHQHGVPEHNLPARAMLQLLNQDKAQIGRIINTYISSGEVTYGGPSGRIRL
jgi:phage gpG-like protein